MIFISHRGNLFGQNKQTENTIEQINICLTKGIDVEIDIWKTNFGLKLGHDFPKNNVDIDWLMEKREFLWIHCKNLEAFQFLDTFNCFNLFVHDKDPVVITTKGYRWYYMGNDAPNGICVLPEQFNKKIIPSTKGICTDFPIEFNSDKYE